MMFYTMVTGWMMYYAWLAVSGQLLEANSKVQSTTEQFADMLANPGTMILWTVIKLRLRLAFVLGLQNGVEKVTKVMMLLLITLMIVLNSVMRDTTGEGLRFYLIPDIERAGQKGWGNVIFAAMTHAFYTECRHGSR